MARTQLAVLEELETANRKIIREREDRFVREAMARWVQTRTQMRNAVSFFYKVNGGSIPANANMNQVRDQLASILQDTLQYFSMKIPLWKNKIYAETYLRNAWTLDQVTPPNIKPIIDRSVITAYKSDKLHAKLFEAEQDEKPTIGDKLKTYFNAYLASAMSNIALGAVSGIDEQTARSEIGKETVGFPARRMDGILDTFIRSQVLVSDNQAIEDIGDQNDHILENWIWQTREDFKVCPDCEPLDLLPYDEVPGWVKNQIAEWGKLHVFCRCFWRLVPQGWNKLYDKKIAGAEGRMVLLDDKGRPTDQITVSFNKWVLNN